MNDSERAIGPATQAPSQAGRRARRAVRLPVSPERIHVLEEIHLRDGVSHADEGKEPAGGHDVRARLAGVLAGSFITETIFNLPGIGQYAVTSIFRNDFPSVMGVTIFGAFFIAIANLCVDIVYAYVDPRVRFA